MWDEDIIPDLKFTCELGLTLTLCKNHIDIYELKKTDSPII